jgi:hypothetical protein
MQCVVSSVAYTICIIDEKRKNTIVKEIKNADPHFGKENVLYHASKPMRCKTGKRKNEP